MLYLYFTLNYKKMLFVYKLVWINQMLFINLSDLIFQFISTTISNLYKKPLNRKNIKDIKLQYNNIL